MKTEKNEQELSSTHSTPSESYFARRNRELREIKAKRLATSIYALCYDPAYGSSRTKSLLSQMHLINNLEFLSSKKVHHPSEFIRTPLLILSGGVEPFHFEPLLDTRPEFYEWLRFKKWWEETVFTTWTGRTLSRKNLVLTMRSQDGGAHVDESIRDEEYFELKTSVDPGLMRNKPAVGVTNSFRYVDPLARTSGIIINSSGSDGSIVPEGQGGSWEPIPYAHLECMRQIAFEILMTIGPIISKSSAY